MKRRSFLAALGLAPLMPVVAEPASRPMASGGYAKSTRPYLVGEAVSEAIMPLRRGSDGRLPRAPIPFESLLEWRYENGVMTLVGRR